MTSRHQLMGGALNLYKRENSPYWQCSTYLDGRNRRKSTQTGDLHAARNVAEDWYLEQRGKQRLGALDGKTFQEAAAQFEREYEVITMGERSPRYVHLQKNVLRLHLLPYFGDRKLAEITPGLVQEYRIYRAENPTLRYRQKPETAKPPSRSTMHQEIVTLRQVLKTAHRHGWIDHVPDLSPPYRTSGKISHRAWFSPKEYKQLYEATRRRAKNPRHSRWRWESEQLHDYVLFMANTGLRPDEAGRLEHRDVEIVEDEATGETILVIEVRGKRGVGYCKSTTGAVTPYRRLHERNRPEPTDLVFPKSPSGLLHRVLVEENLKRDRDGNSRTAYSLRHTYICLRLMEGADIYQIAKNCRTSVEMIEKFYASHIKNTLDAAAINVRKPKPARRRKKSEAKRSHRDKRACRRKAES